MEPDRARIGNLLRQLNDDIYEKKHIHFKLVKWEDLNSFYNPSGKQNEYNFQIENCDLFVGLFWHSAGRHTKHEIEVARKHLLPGTILIFNKTAEVTPDHEGSEDEKRFLERHPEEKLEESQEEFNAYLAEQNSVPYKDFTELSGFLTEKLAEYTENIEISENEKQRTYSTISMMIMATRHKPSTKLSLRNHNPESGGDGAF